MELCFDTSSLNSYRKGGNFVKYPTVVCKYFKTNVHSSHWALGAHSARGRRMRRLGPRSNYTTHHGKGDCFLSFFIFIFPCFFSSGKLRLHLALSDKDFGAFLMVADRQSRKP
ncbi:hypothetical protein PanWU01x14_045620 [Parasponia andersonii]|uniref:Uncharacterized protein n=1 Tax=Parasponia andersonii TaxID=3476 RepID=A0A2P5DPI9_PARAD|nr:hypothetical protein PanWU01x14_045620 [Parasponia andersonii]